MSLLSVFVASILGSAHCVGMCGGIVLLYAHNEEKKLQSHISYNFGRLSSYMFLGALAGALGNSLNLAASAAGISQVASLVFGVLLFVWGALIIGKKRVVEPTLPGAALLQKVFRALVAEDSTAPIALRAYIIGTLSTLLPCGWLYMFAAVAAASGSILWGMLVMLVFWLGTLPYLVALGFSSQLLLGKLRNHLPLITGILIMLGGLFSILQHVNASGTENMLYQPEVVEECH